MFSRRIVRISVMMALAAFGSVLAHPVARAEGGDTTEKVTQLNRDALAAIDKREFEKARELLKRALDVCQGAGLEQHPIAARTHIHMGVVIIRGFKNHELGSKQFAKALAIEPNISVTKSVSTPDVEEVFADVKAGVGASAGSGSAAGGGDDGAGTAAGAKKSPARDPEPAAARVQAPSSAGFSYHTVSEVKQGASVVVTVTVEESLKFKKLVLAYRPQGSSDFLGREMEPVGGGAYRAEIPDHATTGTSVSYYMEAQDDEGQPVASRGTEERPLVISFAATTRSLSKAEAAVERKSQERRSEDDDDEGGKYFASLQVGSGVGYTSGTGEVNADTPVAGTVSGALIGHIAPEVGYWVSPGFLVSLQGRFQLVSGPTEIAGTGRTYSPVPAALAVLAKASWFTGSGDFRPFISVGAGGGQIRHVVTFSNLMDCGPSRNQTCVDSVAAGPILAQLGGGFIYRLNPSFGLVLSSNAQVAAPNFTLNVDVNAGVGFSF